MNKMTSLQRLPDDLQRYLRAFLTVQELVILTRVSRRFRKFSPFRYSPTQRFMISYFYRTSRSTETRHRYYLFSHLPYHPQGFYPVPIQSIDRNAPLIEIILHNEFRREEQYRIKLYRPYFPQKTIAEYLTEYDPGYDSISRRIVWREDL